MSLKFFPKQNYEKFPVSASFEGDMEEGEVLTAQSVTCIDNTGEDATSSMLSNPVNDGGQKAQVTVEGGDQALSPYKITFRVVTDTDNQWEHEFNCKVKEL